MGKRIEDKKVKDTEGYSKKDFKEIAEYIAQEKSDRKKKRRDKEKDWKEVDRQVAMQPDSQIKKQADGSIDPAMAWLPELEIPAQRQALELLTADVRRMLFPDAGPWFECHVDATDKYYRDLQDNLRISGDELDLVSDVTQDNVNEIAESLLVNLHRQFDYRGNYDLINAEALKYGLGVGRARLVKKQAYFHTAQGTIKKDMKIPVLLPVSTKDFYPDCSRHHLQNEGIEIGPMDIRCYYQRYEDILVASENGSDDPDDYNGGWIKSNVRGLEPDKDQNIELIEAEGDLVCSIGSGAVFHPAVTVTVAVYQSKGKTQTSLVRWRFNQFSHSYIKHHYHRESVDDPYGVGPLTMGSAIQKAASETLNWTMVAAALNALPPLAYDKDDPYYAQSGGPTMYPGKPIPSLGDVVPLQVGSPSNLSSIYGILLEQYAQLTGVTAPRLGAQTNSHTTAFAKNAELQQGTIRTVDYANTVMHGPLQQWLYKCLEMSKETLKGEEIPIYLTQSAGYVSLKGEKVVPENLLINVYGASGPAEDNAEKGAKVQAFQMALGIEPLKRQLQEGTPMDLEKLQKAMLKIGGISDTDQYYQAGAGVAPGAEGAPAVAGTGQGGVQNSVPAAIQAVLQAQGQ